MPARDLCKMGEMCEDSEEGKRPSIDEASTPIRGSVQTLTRFEGLGLSTVSVRAESTT